MNFCLSCTAGEKKQELLKAFIAKGLQWKMKLLSAIFQKP